MIIFYLILMNKPTPAPTKTTTSRVTSEKSITEEELNIVKNHLTHSKIIILLLNRLISIKKMQAFQQIHYIPQRELKIQQRMKKVIEGVFRRQDYLSKWQGFQNIRKLALNSQNRDHLHLKDILKKQRSTAIRLLTAFVIGKKRDLLHSMLNQLKDRGQSKQAKLNSNCRLVIRKIVKIFGRKVGEVFFRIKDSRVIVGQNKKLRLMFKIIKEIKSQNTRWAFANLRREMLRNRQQKVREQIKELDMKLDIGQDEEQKGLQDKLKQLTDQLQGIRKEREDIQAGLQNEIKQVESRNKEMKDHLEDLKVKQQQMKQKIVEVDEQLKTPFSLEQIYQLCYQNLLWNVTQGDQKSFKKEDLLRSLQIPLVPIDLPIDQLKQQNDVLKQLLSEYVLLYGQKKLPQGCKLQLPYQYLLKQNNVLYKMLMTLLPNAQFLKEELLRIKQTYQSVQSMIKQYKVK